MAPFCALLLLPLLLLDIAPVSAKWQTLRGQAPIVIANGGTSGLFPDQTSAAYLDALNSSLPGVVLSCNLQLAKSGPSGTGICRTNVDLKNSTSIGSYPQFNTTRIVNNVSTEGWFAVDISYENLLKYAKAIQSSQARTPAFDTVYNLLRVDEVASLVNNTPSTWWLNSEYTTFIEANSNYSVSEYLVQNIPVLSPGYVSATEAGLLVKIQANATMAGTKFIYKFLDLELLDPSINETYSTLLKNLTYIRTFASGILVPKTYILSYDSNSLYLNSPSSLVDDAHKANLEVYAYGFANDQWPNSYNYTLDPVSEILYFIDNYNFSVDGVFTDFPTTVSEAISCYATNSRNGSSQNKETKPRKQKVISHNGDSGKYPGATIPAYNSAIQAGVDYIDCLVQITKDSVPFCRPTADLLDSTTVASTPFFQQFFHSYPRFNGGNKGVYAFDLTWDQISTLNSSMFSPFGEDFAVFRDRGYDNQFGILTLTEFLGLAKKNSVGVLIDIQHAVYLRNMHNLGVVDAVADTLVTAGYNASDDVILQSEDSSALARLRDLNVTYPLMYRAIWSADNPISMDSSDFVDIKKYASSVNIHNRLIEPLDGSYFLDGATHLIQFAHDQNLTAYFQVQQNEVISLANDVKADPTLELHMLVEYYKIDGIITDFPKTVTNYFDNQCLRNGLASSPPTNFTIPLVVPGYFDSQFPPSPPAALPPNLVVPEAPLSGVSDTVSPAAAPLDNSAASNLSKHLLSTMLIVIILHSYIVVWSQVI